MRLSAWMTDHEESLTMPSITGLHTCRKRTGTVHTFWAPHADQPMVVHSILFFGQGPRDDSHAPPGIFGCLRLV